MKVLVTGGAGFIGSHVVDALIGEGYEVVVADNLSAGNEKNINPRARFYRVDIRDPQLEEVFAKERPDIVDHHAAQISVRISVQKPMEDAQINILGSLNVIECCKKYDVKNLVYISSGGAVYGEPVYLPCDERHPVDPLCQYGATKHAPEHYLYMYRQLYGLNYVSLRYPNVYGPRQDPAGEAGVVAIFVGQMLRGEPVTVNGTGEQERDFVYVGDCARANLLAVRREGGEIFNIGCGVGTTVNEIFARLKEITGYELEPQFGPAKPGETFRIYLDSAKARRELGWEPAVSFEDGLRRTVDFFRARTS